MRQTGSDITQSGGGELRNQRHLLGNRGKFKQRRRKGRIRKAELGFTGSELGVNWKWHCRRGVQRGSHLFGSNRSHSGSSPKSLPFLFLLAPPSDCQSCILSLPHTTTFGPCKSSFFHTQNLALSIPH